MEKRNFRCTVCSGVGVRLAERTSGSTSGVGNTILGISTFPEASLSSLSTDSANKGELVFPFWLSLSGGRLPDGYSERRRDCYKRQPIATP